MERMKRIGEERALINAQSKKRKRTWVWRTLEGDSLLKMASERKWRGKRTRAKRKQTMLYWMLTGLVYMVSLKKRSISEKSGDLIHFRKHRTEEEPTKWKP